MESKDEVRLPVEMLGRILHFLAMDGASIAWQHLAYLTHKNDALKNIAKKMQRPLVLRVGFGEEDETVFFLPFLKATVTHIEIDWGDDGPTDVIDEVPNDDIVHEYKAAGEYTVRVFPHGPGVNGVWLDHLGWDIFTDRWKVDYWWRPLKSLDTLGTLGINSLEALFINAEEFNLPLSHLDVSNIVNTSYMFHRARSFNQPIGNWNVSNVTDMSYMFDGTHEFNQNIGKWNVSRVKLMCDLFSNATSFDKPLGDWDTSNVENMRGMFFACSSFDQDISKWNVSNVTDMRSMFHVAHSFNQPIGCWNVSKVESMEMMFAEARSFNQPIGGWDVSSVTNMMYMFNEAGQFNQDIGAWNVSNVKDVDNMLSQADKFDLSCIDRWNLSLDLKKRLY